ncbi:hypothetical protein [Evansella halocellulosilytica]|uniref:hypothetical protein n=1 Tax=Evansella halocellulosilytica TaxID=2011013 RepID=UPI000BB6DE08|nr:hypothetical protein [Evansella halocellulosilytica]
MDKTKLSLYWHKFMYKWHRTKSLYYGSKRHEEKVKRHDMMIQQLTETFETNIAHERTDNYETETDPAVENEPEYETSINNK